MANLVSLPQQQTFEWQGPCIYCGSTGTIEHPLSREHIVPAGLGGRLILPRASCRECSGVTSKIERQVLRDMLGEAREQIGSPTRRPEQRRGEFRVGIFDATPDDSLPPDFGEAGFEWRPAQGSERPIVLMLLRLAPPGILWGREPSNEFLVTGLTGYADEVARRPELEPGKSWGVFQKISPDIFSRFLSKIAFSAAVAVFGPKAFSSPLPKLILGDGAGISHFVGSAFANTRRKGANAHDLSFHVTQDHLVARVRVFANLGVQAYDVVVGDGSLASNLAICALSARWTLAPQVAPFGPTAPSTTP